MEPVAEATSPLDQLEPGSTGGFATRVAARLIDWAVHFALAFIGGLAGGFLVGFLSALGAIESSWAAETGTGTGTGILWNLMWGAVAAVLYETVCEGVGGTTVGKLVLGYRVVTTDLEPCTVGKALVRSLAYYVDSLVFGVVAYSSMSSSPFNQRYGDKWAKTLVVRASAVPAAARRPAGLVMMGLAAGCAVYGLVVCASVVVQML